MAPSPYKPPEVAEVSKKVFFSCHWGIKACISLHVLAARQEQHSRSGSGSSVRLERQPVTLEVAGSSPVRFATLFQRRNGRLRAAFLCPGIVRFSGTCSFACFFPRRIPAGVVPLHKSPRFE